MNSDLERAIPAALGPSRLYREIVHRPDGRLAAWIGGAFDVLARPGETLRVRPNVATSW